MDEAVEEVIRLLTESGELDDTLILVTADHSHTMTIHGYSERGNAINGKGPTKSSHAHSAILLRQIQQSDDYCDSSRSGLSTDLLDDDLPYSTLTYANGKAFYDHNIPYNCTHVTRCDRGLCCFIRDDLDRTW